MGKIRYNGWFYKMAMVPFDMIKLKETGWLLFTKPIANNAYIADANFHYTECGMAKLLQESCKFMESLITKRYMHIKH